MSDKKSKDLNQVLQDLHYVSLNRPLHTAFDPSTGKLYIASHHLMSTGETDLFGVAIEADALLELLFATSQIEKDYRKLIEEKAKSNSVQ